MTESPAPAPTSSPPQGASLRIGGWSASDDVAAADAARAVAGEPYPTRPAPDPDLRPEPTEPQDRPASAAVARPTTPARWRVGFPIAMVLLIAAIPTLLLVGRSVVLGSNEGAVENEVSDPASPGWQAATDP